MSLFEKLQTVIMLVLSSGVVITQVLLWLRPREAEARG